MSKDTYRDRLKAAAWDWLESRTWWKRGVKRLRKDRRVGRTEKRGAKQQDKRDIESDR